MVLNLLIIFGLMLLADKLINDDEVINTTCSKYCKNENNQLKIEQAKRLGTVTCSICIMLHCTLSVTQPLFNMAMEDAI